MQTPSILGVVNVTVDSFSDGGRFFDPSHAADHAVALHRAGATAIDLGPASSNPDAEPVSAEEEIRRLTPVVEKIGELLGEQRIALSLDSYLPATQRWALGQGFAFLNDIRGFPDESSPAESMYPELAASSAQLIVMHSVQRVGIATREATEPERVWDGLLEFFDQRFQALIDAGVDEERLILDPGMGYFLGSNPESSLVVLRRIPKLRARYGRPVLISVSRKSIVAAMIGAPERPPLERAAGTLAAELWSIAAGADWIRTHDVRALRDALAVQKALGTPGEAALSSPPPLE